MKRQRSNSIDLFEQTNSAHSPARSVLSSSGAPRSDAGGGDGHSVGGGGGGAGGGGGGVVVDEATRQKILHAERMRIALASMSAEQQERFEFFRRSHFHRDAVKKMMTDAFARVRALNVEGYDNAPISAFPAAATAAAAGRGGGGGGGGEEGGGDGPRSLRVDMNDQMVIVVGALCKMFVGDLVHGARQVMDERGEEGAIRPDHLREAHRRAVKEKRLPVMRPLPTPPPPPSSV